MKKIIISIIASFLISGCTQDGGGVTADVLDIEKNEAYSVSQIKKFETTAIKYGEKRAEIMSKVFIPKDLETGNKKVKMNGWDIVVHEQGFVNNLLKIVVSASKNKKTIDFKPFWYVNPPISNKECVDENGDGKTTREECVYDYDTNSVLKQIIWESMVSQQPEIK